MSSKRPVAPPPRIPGFTYLSLLGSGGFSDVYLYEQDRPRRKVAVKVLLSDLKTEGARRRFESEANLMAQLSSHPYIVTIFEAEVTEDGHSYLAMEYCSRPSLDVRYRRQRFSVDEVLAVGIQVASAVETAHRAGIAHRDIKPANILVTDYNRPALTDFGISGTLGTDADEDAGMSIPWSPPEQFRDGPVDGVMVDVWALGATLYTLLAGRSPFVMPGADNSQRELISRITSMPVPRLGRADVPASLELALSTAMAKSPASRYSSAHAFALALQRIQAELNLSVTPFEVLEEPSQEDHHPDDGFEETRVRSIAAIDPERTGSSPTFPARTRPSVPAPATPTVQNPAAQTPAAGAARAAQPQVPGQLFEGVPPQRSADDWAQATMLRGGPTSTAPSAPAAAPEFDEATVQRGAQRAPVAPAAPAGPHPGQPAVQTGGPSWHAAGPELDATVSRSALPAEPAQDQADDAEAHPSRRNLWLAITGGTLLVLAVVVGIIMANTAPETKALPQETINRPPADALDNGTVPDVSGLAGTIGASGRVTFTWTNPQPKDGDTYKWRVYALTGSGDFQSTESPTAEVALNPAEPTCIQVILVRSDGASSPQEQDSIACVRP
ncbi:serine/threonine-protein kinase [Pseudarthrobacter sp. J75]|uniref:serine/threonine-protein kinase n=1 Tax=unclassified Pseudarthrobacter TaxID=2647000 RepID=UPI002E808663|nr:MULTISPECIES: serine/threonine-protein kinase [unclassified Pseudarthrobacter]MEE2521706.1 serine/threonine-protein kinase [Pseudarthrobacter sp. J47]MEE2527783.1 serine/threonine-protein kinase [Pseudarthrobacter sp. J75]MEE2569351.1 serine/threonine-protein kinase [Pseudarthrobacter sp. J64]